MSEWQDISTAPKNGETVILAAFREGGEAYWSCAAAFESAMKSHTNCASYCGWFPRLPMLTDPTNFRREIMSEGEVIGHSYPPTHWKPLDPPK